MLFPSNGFGPISSGSGGLRSEHGKKRDHGSTTEITEIRNGRVVTPDRVIENGQIVVTGGVIAHVGQTPDKTLPRATTIDADGRVVMPGLVDLHGDDIEQHLAPRSGARVDVRTALTTADRTNLLNGVTTKFHAVAFEDALDDGRTLENASSIAAELETEEYTLGDNRLHARCELTEASVRSIRKAVSAYDVDLLSIMHHAPGDGQYDEESFERHYIEDRSWASERVEELAAVRRSIGESTRHERIDRIVEIAETAGIPLASHDDETPHDVETMADHGVEISEYPLTMDAAHRADELGLTAAMGAPNLVRGGSLWDNLSARAAIENGYVDVLCADYHPPSLLAAPFVDTGEPLSTRVNRVTRNPANVVGLPNRGRIAVGARADIIVVEPTDTPTVERVLVEGAEAARTGPIAQRSERPPRPVGS